MAKLVSVLIAAYQAKDFIERPIQSVIRQIYPHWEIVIASDDQANYAKILHDKGIRDNRIRFTSTGKKGAGASAARNIALDQARGEVMAVLDADDAFAPDKLERLVPLAVKHGAATSNLNIVQTGTGKEFPSLTQNFPPGLLSPENYIRANMHSFSLLVWDRKRSDVRWNENIFWLEDLVHGLGMYNKLDGVYYEPSVLHSYYKGGNSVTNNPDAAQAHKIIKAGEDLIARAQEGSLNIFKPDALDALVRYRRALLDLEKRFFAAPPDDAVMGFYDFFKANRDQFFAW